MPIYNEEFFELSKRPNALCLLKAAGRLRRDPHYAIERQDSETTVIGCVCGGQLFFEDESGRLAIRQGESFLLRSHAPYRIFADPRNPPEILWLNLTGRLPDALTGLYFDNALPVVAALDCAPAIRALVACAQKSEDIQLPLHALCLSLHAHQKREAETTDSMEVAAQMERSIVASIQTGFTVPALAAQFGLSTASVNRLFREKYAQTPYQYYQTVRHEIARSLLRGTALSIDDIAARLGFFDRNHFTAAFLHREGLAPAAYRKKENRTTCC